MESIHGIIKTANEYLWGPPMLILLFGVHIFLTVRLGFIQKHLLKGIKLSFKSEQKGEGDVSHFGALMTALAATIGTGNIVGVSTAIALGGPGAVLWMWLTGVFGISTKYAEAVLAVKYRVKTPAGTMLGGPMYALKNGLNMGWLAVLFCVFASIAAFGIGNTVQANSISHLAEDTFGIAPQISGAVLAALTAVVILGGIKSIAKVCARLVPVMALLYILGCLIIIFINIEYLVPALSLIFKSAFSAQSAAGGFAGSALMTAMRYGVSRGLFSNESGLGSAPIAAAAAKTDRPVTQALVSASGTFWDTVVVCALTGLVICTAIIKNPSAAAGLQGAQLTKTAFSQIPVVGPAVLTLGLLTFVYSTILGWSYYGEKSVEYLFGAKSILPYRLLWVAAVYAGAVVSLPLVWDFADAMNALMAIPNIISLFLLSSVIAKETKTYFAK